MNLNWNVMTGGLGPLRGRAASCKPAGSIRRGECAEGTHQLRLKGVELWQSFRFEFRILRCRVWALPLVQLSAGLIIVMTVGATWDFARAGAPLANGICCRYFFYNRCAAASASAGITG